MNTELLPREGTVLCAVSGGADSMYLLERLRELGYAVAAAHYDHGLRPSSARDAAFVAEWCRERDIPFVTERGDAAAYAKAHRLGIEAAARVLRYGFLERAAEELGAAVIATAHTLDDNAETVLMRLVRGSGLAGLGGIPPRRGRIVRPMLEVSREEVLAYLAARNIPHAEDESNAGDEYMRNRLRHRVIPLLEAENPAFRAAVGRTARLLREDEAYLDGQARAFLEREARGTSLPAESLAALPAPVARRAVRLMAGPGLDAEQTERVLRLAGAGAGGAADLTGTRVRVSQGVVTFGGEESGAMPDRRVQPGETLSLPEAGLCLRCEKIRTFPSVVHKSFNTFIFQCEKIHGNILVGSRRPGDAYRPAGRGCTKTLKALFMENRVPVWERDRVPVLRDEAGVLAAEGFPPAERAAARPGDRDLYKLEFTRLTPEEEG